MTLGELLVLAFLEFHPLPVCTFAYPHGVVTHETSCPAKDLGNDAGLFNDGKGLKRCTRRFTA
jgi:hypothetical protein